MSKLYIVPTPIGNMEDITLRAIRVLGEVDFILAEDTRTTGKLLQHHKISNRLVSYHIHNEHHKVKKVVEELKKGKSAAITSDAGTPGISDPGYLLIRACIENDVEIVSLPGASAVISALVGSGIPCDRFIFEGFLPPKKGRKTKWENIAQEKRTVVLYESPHRIIKALKEMTTYLEEDRKICVAREISKIYETFHRGTAGELLEYFTEFPPKGEMVILISAK